MFPAGGQDVRATTGVLSAWTTVDNSLPLSWVCRCTIKVQWNAFLLSMTM